MVVVINSQIYFDTSKAHIVHYFYPQGEWYIKSWWKPFTFHSTGVVSLSPGGVLQVIDFTMIIFDLNCFCAILEKPVTDLIVDTEIVNVEVLDHDDETEKTPTDFWYN